jgi:hypothetical protein
MKPVHTILLTSAFLAATYTAAPGSANAGERECLAQSTAKTIAAQRVDADIAAAVEVARLGRSVRSEVFVLEASVKGEDFAWLDFPDQCVIQDMLAHELDDLHERAQAFRAHEAELRQIQFQVVMGRLERAVFEIELAWKNGKIAADVAQKAMDEMRQEAFDYLASLGATQIRERLQEAVTVLIERGMQAEDRDIAQQEFFVKFYTIRLDAALAVWVARGVDGSATQEDLMRISDCLVALERLKRFSKPYDCKG